MKIIHSGFTSNDTEAYKQKLEGVVSGLPTTTMSIIREYYQLRVLSDLSEKQSDRIEEILELATNNEAIDAWITEIEHALGHQIGFLTQESRQSYENQRAFLKERLGIADLCKEQADTTQDITFPASLPHLQIVSC